MSLIPKLQKSNLAVARALNLVSTYNSIRSPSYSSYLKYFLSQPLYFSTITKVFYMRSSLLFPAPRTRWRGEFYRGGGAPLPFPLARG